MTSPGVLQISSMKDRCSAAEWQARIDLAACYRLVDIFGMSDMMANHISSHVPGEPGAFLINPYGMMYEEITASSLIKVDIAGNILAKPDFGDASPGRRPPGRVRPQAAAGGLAALAPGERDRHAAQRRPFGRQRRPGAGHLSRQPGALAARRCAAAPRRLADPDNNPRRHR